MRGPARARPHGPRTEPCFRPPMPSARSLWRRNGVRWGRTRSVCTRFRFLIAFWDAPPYTLHSNRSASARAVSRVPYLTPQPTSWRQYTPRRRTPRAARRALHAAPRAPRCAPRPARASVMAAPEPQSRPEPRFSPEYAAFFAPRTHAFETVHLRTPASALNLRTLVPQSRRADRAFHAVTAAVVCAVGVAVAAAVFASDQLTRGLVLGIYRLAARGLAHDPDTAGATRVGAAVAALTLLGTASVTAASVLAVFVAPLASSSGIPQLKATLNGVRVPAFLSLKTAAVKAVGVALSTGGGLICGRQGAMSHIGAAIGAGISQAACTAARRRWFDSGPLAPAFRGLRTQEWKLNFAAVGAAIGIATTFSAPMGGWMWIFEEAVTHWDWRLGFLALGGTLTGVFTISVLRFLSVGMPGGFPTVSVAGPGQLINESALEPRFLFKDLPGFLLLGVCGGMFGAALPYINRRITLLRYKFPHPGFRIGEVAFIAALVNLGRIGIPYLADDCQLIADDNVQTALGPIGDQDFSQFNCPDGSFSPWAAVIYNPLAAVIRIALYAPGSSSLPIGALAAASAYYAFFIIWSFGMPVPAGVFLPGFVLGSVFGRLFGALVQVVFPARTDLDVESYAFVGVVSMLSGISRGVSVSIIALEATAQLNAAYVATLVAFVAKHVADALNPRSIYVVHIELKGMPYLHDVVPHPELYYQVRVADVMSTNVMSVRCRPRVEELLQTLSTTTHNAFPVYYKNPGPNGKGRSSRSYDVGEIAHAVSEALELGLDPTAPAAIAAARDSAGEIAPPNQSTSSSSDSAEEHRAYVRFGSSVDDGGDTETGSPLPLKRSSRGTVVLEDPELRRVMPLRSQNAGGANPEGDAVVFGRRPLQFRTSIVMADGAKNFTAAFFENGMTRHVQFGNRARMLTDAMFSQEQSTQVRQLAPELAPQAQQMLAQPLQESLHMGAGSNPDPLPSQTHETGIPEFSLVGIIDRATLLALLDAAIERRDTSKGVGREWFDSAWPNNQRAKNAQELYDRVRAANIGRTVIDLEEYLDPDPLFISDRAMTHAAYKLFRRTGARHILVNNTRESRIGGIITRKDILPASIKDTIHQLSQADSLMV